MHSNTQPSFFTTIKTEPRVRVTTENQTNLSSSFNSGDTYQYRFRQVRNSQEERQKSFKYNPPSNNIQGISVPFETRNKLHGSFAGITSSEQISKQNPIRQWHLQNNKYDKKSQITQKIDTSKYNFLSAYERKPYEYLTMFSTNSNNADSTKNKNQNKITPVKHGTTSGETTIETLQKIMIDSRNDRQKLDIQSYQDKNNLTNYENPPVHQYHRRQPSYRSVNAPFDTSFSKRVSEQSDPKKITQQSTIQQLQASQRSFSIVQSKLTKVQEKNKSMFQLINQREADIKRLEDQLEQQRFIKKLYEQLKRTYSLEISMKDQLEDQNKSAYQRVQKLEEQKNQLQQKLKKAVSAMEEREIFHRNQKASQSSLEKDVSILQTKYNKLLEENRSLKGGKMKAQEQRSIIQRQLRSANQKNATLDRDIVLLQNNLKEIKENDDLRKRNIINLENRIQNLNKQLENALTNCESFQKEKSLLREALNFKESQLKTELQSFELFSSQKLEEKQRQINIHQQINKQLENSLYKTISQKETEIAQHKTRQAQAKIQLSQKNRKINQLLQISLKEKEHNQALISSLNKQFQEFKNSSAILTNDLKDLKVLKEENKLLKDSAQTNKEWKQKYFQTQSQLEGMKVKNALLISNLKSLEEKPKPLFQSVGSETDQIILNDNEELYWQSFIGGQLIIEKSSEQINFNQQSNEAFSQIISIKIGNEILNSSQKIDTIQRSRIPLNQVFSLVLNECKYQAMRLNEVNAKIEPHQLQLQETKMIKKSSLQQAVIQLEDTKQQQSIFYLEKQILDLQSQLEKKTFLIDEKQEEKQEIIKFYQKKIQQYDAKIIHTVNQSDTLIKNAAWAQSTIRSDSVTSTPRNKSKFLKRDQDKFHARKRRILTSPKLSSTQQLEDISTKQILPPQLKTHDLDQQQLVLKIQQQDGVIKNLRKKIDEYSFLNQQLQEYTQGIKNNSQEDIYIVYQCYQEVLEIFNIEWDSQKSPPPHSKLISAINLFTKKIQELMKSLQNLQTQTLFLTNQNSLLKQKQQEMLRRCEFMISSAEAENDVLVRKYETIYKKLEYADHYVAMIQKMLEESNDRVARLNLAALSQQYGDKGEQKILEVVNKQQSLKVDEDLRQGCDKKIIHQQEVLIKIHSNIKKEPHLIQKKVRSIVEQEITACDFVIKNPHSPASGELTSIAVSDQRKNPQKIRKLKK